MIKFPLTCLLVYSCFSASGQDILTLEAAIETGLVNNYGINISRNESRIAENNSTPGNAGMLPRLNVSGAYAHSLTSAKVEVVSGGTLDDNTANTDLLTAGVNLNWTLFDGLKMFITYDKLKKLKAIGDLELKISIENTLAKIIGAYYDIIRQGKQRDIISEQVAISRFRLDLSKMEYETGSGSELEYIKAKVELNADIAALSSQETACLNALATLNNLMARDVRIPFRVQDTIPLLARMNYDLLRAGMLEGNRNLLVLNRNIEVSALDVRSAGASQWPVLDLTAGFDYYRNNTEASFIRYNRNFGPIIGVSAAMNIFNGLNLQREKQNALITQSTTELEKMQTENRLDAYLLKIYNDYDNQLEMVDFERENIALAQKNMEIARESYRVGAISSLELREIQKDLLDAGTRLVAAEFRAKLTETELLLISGRLLR
jgi:outer membrane protein TolC